MEGGGDADVEIGHDWGQEDVMKVGSNDGGGDGEVQQWCWVCILFASSLGFITGIPWVHFSHTIPVPAEPIPITAQVRYLWVTGAVLHETHGTSGTRGFSPLIILIKI